jgi:hypothetical protein
MGASFNNRLFITGTLRAGTTLLDKVLSGHPSVTVASQPFFRLFTHVKERYHHEKKIKSLPLPTHFCEPTHLRKNLDHYLETLNLNESDISFLKQRIPETNRRWSPAITPESLSLLKPGTFFQLLEQGMDIVHKVYGTPETEIVGIKEVLCEEFLPILLRKGYKGIIVSRDPRAVVSSASTGQYEKYVGKIRPVLLNIRNWRKSVAYAISLRENPHFCLIRYEDLVCEPGKTLRWITDFLGVEPFGVDFSYNHIRNQDGSAWKGNSSYGDMEGIGKDSLSIWSAKLSKKEVSFIEYCCCAEMIYLGYEVTSNPLATEIEDFREFRVQERINYAVEHHLDGRNVIKEKERFSYLAGDAMPSEGVAYDYFFSPKVWQVLSSSFDRFLSDRRSSK